MFTPLDNKLIGRNVAKLRKHREIKAADMAGRLGISETAYTKYERGETAITLEFLNKVAEQFDVNPNEFLNATPQNIIENIHDNEQVNIGNNTNTATVINNSEKQDQLMELLMKQNEKLAVLVEKLAEKL